MFESCSEEDEKAFLVSIEKTADVWKLIIKDSVERRKVCLEEFRNFAQEEKESLDLKWIEIAAMRQTALCAENELFWLLKKKKLVEKSLSKRKEAQEIKDAASLNRKSRKVKKGSGEKTSTTEELLLDLPVESTNYTFLDGLKKQFQQNIGILGNCFSFLGQNKSKDL